QQAGEEYSTAVRPDGDLRASDGRRIQWHTQAEGFAAEFAVQHLHESRLAAGANREPGRSCAARGSASGGDRLSLFRGQHAGRPFFCVHTGGTQQKCGQISPLAERGTRGTSGGGSASYTCGRSDAQGQTMTDAL